MSAYEAPAFPGQHDHGMGQIESWAGISARDYFATHAPKEVLSLDGWSIEYCQTFLGLPENEKYSSRKHYALIIAKLSYEYADAMLVARLKS